MIRHVENNSSTIYILDDDVIFAENLSDVLRRNGYLTSVYDDALHFLSKIKAAQPGLVLLDICLNQGIDGIDLAHILTREYQIPIIFISGHEEKDLLKRIESTESRMFLNKPLNEKELLFNIAILLNKNDPSTTPDPGKGKVKHNPLYFTIKKGTGREKIRIDEIETIEADGNYSLIFTGDKKYTSSMTLKKIEEHIGNEFLLRVHRKYMVNIHKIDAITRNMIHIGDRKIPVGTRYKSILQQYFQRI